MRIKFFLSAFVLGAMLSLHSTSMAQGMSSPTKTSGIGVGVESLLSGPAGPSLVYQGSSYHAELIFGLYDRVATTLLFSGRFYYQIHAGDLSDFSLGGGIGIVNTDTPAGDDTNLHLEGGAKIRVFLAPHVALSTSLGMAIVSDEGTSSAIITGQLLGSMGITYFFF